MRIDVITLFPELFSAHLVHGVTRRAFEPGRIDVHLWPLRAFGDPPHARVDDRPYGGGPGMVLLAEPLERVLAAIRAARAEDVPAPLVSFSPAGTLLRQARVGEFANGPGAILLCARYEGIDQRFVDAHVDLELSIGDYVLVGWRAAGAGPARRARPAAARSARRRALAPAGQLLRGSARLPALTAGPSGSPTVPQSPRFCCRATTRRSTHGAASSRSP